MPSDIHALSETGINLQPFLSIIFLVLVGIYTIFTVVLYYHWQTYSNDPKGRILTYTIYFITTLPLIITMGVLLLNL